MNTSDFSRVSVHGGHSGQFCHHAKDSLEDVVQAYIAAGFSWVGITEHMPPLDDSKRYPDEAASGLEASAMQERFVRYFDECRRLQQQYAGQIQLFTAFETETYTGSAGYVRQLIEATRPDYIVGSVHHVDGFGIDVDVSLYEQATAHVGSLEQLYCAYFDAQFAMLNELKPAVVGHFDLVRIFDPDYLHTMQLRSVWSRVERNLTLIADEKLIIDYNLRGFDKTLEQYPSMPVLNRALSMEIAIVPGDDSHGVSSVGRNYDRGVSVLAGLGHNCQWQQPRLFNW